MAFLLDENLKFVYLVHVALQASVMVGFLATPEMKFGFSNPKYPMILTETFLIQQLKTVSLYFRRCCLTDTCGNREASLSGYTSMGCLK